MSVVGVDECGRGCLYGDVVAGAVVLKPREDLDTEADRASYDALTDSKVLSAKKRKHLADVLFSGRLTITYGIGRASPREIDEINILQATMLAMRRALDAAALAAPSVPAAPADPFTKILVDGTYFRGWRDVPYECIVKGDLHVKAISAASIIAKYTRDSEIVTAVANNPALAPYGLATNMGYGTLTHRRALVALGPLPDHRMTFEPLASQLALTPNALPA